MTADPEVVSVQHHALAAIYLREDAVPILQEVWLAPEPFLNVGKFRPHRYSIPDRPGRSQSLYRLSYRPTTGIDVNTNLYKYLLSEI